jgi:DNA uptake protein ComE-like DNA-binding protein
VNINTATATELMVLRGIGAERAARIVAARPFASPLELVSRSIITEKMYKMIAAQLHLSPVKDD